MEKSKLTVIVPAYNDAPGIEKFLPVLIAAAKKHNWEIIVVDDCSTDNTEEVLRSFGSSIRILKNRVNSGYGRSLKNGIIAADTEWVATMDADGQHRIEDLEKMAAELNENLDALIGRRTNDSHQPLMRRPGKWVLKRAADMLAGSKIPDINCGLRIFRRNVMLCVLSITSDRFSFSTSSLIALLQLGCNVRYFPVTIDRRIGKSTVKQFRDGIYTLMLMIRLTFLFKPLRILFPIGAALLAFALFLLGIHLFVEKMTYSIIMVWLTGLLLFLFSLLADQVSGIRRDALVRAVVAMKSKRNTACALAETGHALTPPPGL